MTKAIINEISSEVSKEKPNEAVLPADLARKLISYDPDAGVFRWNVATSRVIRVGSIAGGKTTRGRHAIKINGRLYYSHRLAWLLVTGMWPTDQIDHIDGDPLNNRLSNLRACTHAENHQNRALPRNNKSGEIGVHWVEKLGRWQAQIKTNYKMQNLGFFSQKNDAVAAYAKAKEKLHTFNPSVPARASRQQAGVA